MVSATVSSSVAAPGALDVGRPALLSSWIQSCRGSNAAGSKLCDEPSMIPAAFSCSRAPLAQWVGGASPGSSALPPALDATGSGSYCGTPQPKRSPRPIMMGNVFSMVQASLQSLLYVPQPGIKSQPCSMKSKIRSNAVVRRFCSICLKPKQDCGRGASPKATAFGVGHPQVMACRVAETPGWRGCSSWCSDPRRTCPCRSNTTRRRHQRADSARRTSSASCRSS